MPHFSGKEFFESKLFFVVGIIVLGVLSVNLTRVQLKDRAIRSEIAKLQSEVDTLERERADHQALIALLGTPDFMEKEARQTLGFVKPGEQVVVIEKKNGECPDASVGIPTLRRDKMQNVRNGECGDGQDGMHDMSNPRKWWVYFFGS